MFLKVPYSGLKRNIKKFFYTSNFINILKNNGIKKCSIPLVEKIPFDSTILIGHTYGKKDSQNKTILPSNISSLLLENLEKFNSIIFSGDVFYEPSTRKWNELRNLIPNNIAIYIAPGNHDVGESGKDNSLNDIFESSPFFRGNVFQINLDNQQIIIENSSLKKNKKVDQKVIDIINKKEDKNEFYLIRHHAPVKEVLSNENKFIKTYSQSIINLSNLLDKKTTIIFGDYGQSKFKPRYICREFKNVKVIGNGLGGIKNDTVLILQNNKIFRYFI